MLTDNLHAAELDNYTDHTLLVGVARLRQVRSVNGKYSLITFRHKYFDSPNPKYTCSCIDR